MAFRFVFLVLCVFEGGYNSISKWCGARRGAKRKGLQLFLPLIAPSATSTTTSCPLAARREQREKYRVVAGAAEHTRVGRSPPLGWIIYCCHKWLFGRGRHSSGVKTLINTLTFSRVLFILFFSPPPPCSHNSVCAFYFNGSSTAVSAMMIGQCYSEKNNIASSARWGRAGLKKSSIDFG
jgi:hypothetical protein